MSDEFESRVKQKLSAEEGDVSPEVAERLAAMRRAAVAEAGDDTRARFNFGWAPAGALAAAVATVALVAGLFFFAGPFSGKGAVPVMPGSADEPEFAAAQDVELLTDLEFLAWLEEASSDAG